MDGAGVSAESGARVRALIDKRVVVVCGAGGVGKTTTSAALALAAARAGRRVLVLTIDPSRRLAQTLGVSSHAPEPSALEETRQREAADMIVTAIDSETIAGSSLEDPDRMLRFRWSDISFIRVETPPDQADREWASNWFAFGAYMVLGAALMSEFLDLDD